MMANTNVNKFRFKLKMLVLKMRCCVSMTVKITNPLSHNLTRLSSGSRLTTLHGNTQH